MSGSESQLCLHGQGNTWHQEFTAVVSEVAGQQWGILRQLMLIGFKRICSLKSFFERKGKDRIWLVCLSNEVKINWYSIQRI